MSTFIISLVAGVIFMLVFNYFLLFANQSSILLDSKRSKRKD